MKASWLEAPGLVPIQICTSLQQYLQILRMHRGTHEALRLEAPGLLPVHCSTSLQQHLHILGMQWGPMRLL